jgi:membrane protein YdbS with pleckstrin-like domain
MKSLLKYLGIVLVLVGAIILIVSHFQGNTSNNTILSTSLVLMVVGLVSHIMINKHITD